MYIVNFANKYFQYLKYISEVDKVVFPGRHVSTVRGPQLVDEGMDRQAVWSNSVRTVG